MPWSGRCSNLLDLPPCHQTTYICSGEWCSGEQGTVVEAAAQRNVCRYANIRTSGTPVKYFWWFFLTVAVPSTLRILKWVSVVHTEWCTKCHTIDCASNTFLLLQKHLTPGTELILIVWKIVPNEEHVQCDHRFASQPLANEPLHSSQLFDTSLQKARGTTSLCGPWAACS